MQDKKKENKDKGRTRGKTRGMIKEGQGEGPEEEDKVTLALSFVTACLFFLDGVRERGASSGEAGAAFRRRSLPCISAPMAVAVVLVLVLVLEVWAVAAAREEAVLVQALLRGWALSSDPSEGSAYGRSCCLALLLLLLLLLFVGVVSLSGTLSRCCLSLSRSPRSRCRAVGVPLSLADEELLSRSPRSLSLASLKSRSLLSLSPRSLSRSLSLSLSLW